MNGLNYRHNMSIQNPDKKYRFQMVSKLFGLPPYFEQQLKIVAGLSDRQGTGKWQWWRSTITSTSTMSTTPLSWFISWALNSDIRRPQRPQRPRRPQRLQDQVVKNKNKSRHHRVRVPTKLTQIDARHRAIFALTGWKRELSPIFPWSLKCLRRTITTRCLVCRTVPSSRPSSHCCLLQVWIPMLHLLH